MRWMDFISNYIAYNRNESGKISSHFGLKFAYLWGYFLVKTYAGCDASETVGDDTEYCP